MFGNGIENPNDIAKVLVPLPNLRALWLNGNPVVDNCSNFSMIGDTMPALEILNSQLTNKSGEWAMKFYAKEQLGVDDLNKVERLDLSGKGILNMPSADVFSLMPNLKKLDISNHPEFFLTDSERQAMESAQLDGLDSKEGVSFTETKITIHEVLPKLSAVEDLKCGHKLEEFLIRATAIDGPPLLPKLKMLNGIDFSITDMDERNKIRDCMMLMEKLSLIAGVYVLGQGIGSQAVWYLPDEVGSLINHSDTPNVKVRSFIHSPANSV